MNRCPELAIRLGMVGVAGGGGKGLPETGDAKVSNSLIGAGILPIAALGVFYLCGIWLESTQDARLSDLVAPVSASVLTAICSSWWMLKRYSSPIEIPFVWSVLILAEFVISPGLDYIFDRLPIETSVSIAAFARANWISALFTLGIWLGAVLVPRRRTKFGQAPVNIASVGQSMALLLVAFDCISLAAQLRVVSSSGALLGDLGSARGGGLVGSSVLTPFVRLSDFACLLGSYYSVVSRTRRARRIFGAITIGSALVSLVMPGVLQQRFGILQTLAYVSFPQILFGRWLGGGKGRRLVACLSLLVFGALILNAATVAIRSAVMRGSGDFAGEFQSGLEATHFRHLVVTTAMLVGGVDDLPNGGYFTDNALIGDALVIIPRALFPTKPVTSGEVLNSITLGRAFRSTERGDASMLTAGLLNQLYITTGIWGILPAAMVFAVVGLLAFQFATRKAGVPEYMIMAAVIWLMFGWHAMNNSLTSIEVPGLIVGGLSVWLIRRSHRSPFARRRFASGGIEETLRTTCSGKGAKEY